MNEVRSKKHKKAHKILSYTKPLIILGSTVTGCVFIYNFTSLVGITVGFQVLQQ